MPIDKDREDRFTWQSGEITFIPPEENKKDPKEDQDKKD